MAHGREATERVLLESLEKPRAADPIAVEGMSERELRKLVLLGSRVTALHLWQNIRNYSVSHRGYNVTAAGHVLSGGYLHEVYGYNYKPKPGDTPNIHAEEMVLHQAERIGGLTLVVNLVGEYEPDNHGTAGNGVLAPCTYRCTDKLISSPATDLETIIVCTDPNTYNTRSIPLPLLEGRRWQQEDLSEIDQR